MSKSLRLSEADYAAILKRNPRVKALVRDAKPVAVRKSKYNAQRTTVDGITFASKKEARRYAELRLMEKSGAVMHLRHQIPYELIPPLEGEHGVSYVADFVYLERDGLGNYQRVVEDCKGVRTAVYTIKRKLMLHVHKIKVRET